MTCTVELNWQQQSVCSRLETGTTSQLMGNNMESGNSDQMYEGFLDSIHNTLQHNGSCDKPDLPWLLTTYVSTKKAGERRRRQREEGMSKLGFVWMDQQRSRYKDFSLYLHQVNTRDGAGQQLQVAHAGEIPWSLTAAATTPRYTVRLCWSEGNCA